MSITNTETTTGGPAKLGFETTDSHTTETASPITANPDSHPLITDRSDPDMVVDMNPEVVVGDSPHAPTPVKPRPKVISTGDHWQDMRAFVKQVGKSDLLELAEKYMELPRHDPNGQEREQSETELIVLAIDHFANQLNEIGWGSLIMNGSPTMFTGAFWKSIHDPDNATLLGEFAEAMGISPIAARSHKFRQKLQNQYRSRLRREPTDPNPDQVLVNFLHGTLEINNGVEVMREFRKEDYLTYRLDYDMDESATCPMFDKYLRQVLPDKSSRDVIAEFFGWCLLRNLKLEKVLLLLGDGANGKSVLFEIVRGLLGYQNVTTIGLSMLSKLENRFHLATSLLNYASELKGRCDSDIFKKMVSGEPLEARRLFKDMFTMNKYARLAFNVNVLPKDVELTHGFSRRFLIVPFFKTISKDDQDPDLANKIIASELPGVFNWVMDGMRRLRENRKFTDCPAAEQALNKYLAESDTVAMFIKDQGLVPSDTHKILKETLYQEYRDYCKDSGFHPLHKNEFGHGMSKRHHFHDSKSGGQRFWQAEACGALGD